VPVRGSGDGREGRSDESALAALLAVNNDDHLIIKKNRFMQKRRRTRTDGDRKVSA